MNTPETQSRHSVQRMVRLCNAITEAIREMEKYPDDSVQDIHQPNVIPADSVTPASQPVRPYDYRKHRQDNRT